jgi:hypothetical protein
MLDASVPAAREGRAWSPPHSRSHALTFEALEQVGLHIDNNGAPAAAVGPLGLTLSPDDAPTTLGRLGPIWQATLRTQQLEDELGLPGIVELGFECLRSDRDPVARKPLAPEAIGGLEAPSRERLITYRND